MTPSKRVHSRYLRKLYDLPWLGNSAYLYLTVRRFFCDIENCERQIFAERLPKVTVPYGRRTNRLTDVIRALGLGSGGEEGSRLATRLAISVSPDTLIRQVRQTPAPEHETPRVLGVDDWAKRKGQKYGTILVDLEERVVVDLLEDRTAETLADWLKEHPGVEIITRDRSKTYAKGAKEGAPNATQVADRWHLLENLSDALERLLTRHHKYLRLASETAGREVFAPILEKNCEEDKQDSSNLTKTAVTEVSEPVAVTITNEGVIREVSTPNSQDNYDQSPSESSAVIKVIPAEAIADKTYASVLDNDYEQVSRETSTVTETIAEERVINKASILASKDGFEKLTPKPGIPIETVPQQTKRERDKALRRERSLAQYNEVIELYQQGMNKMEIARKLRIGRKMVRRLINAGQFPERAAYPPRPSPIEKFKPYLRERWEAGCHSAKRLWEEIKAQGFQGGSSTVRRHVAPWRKDLRERSDGHTVFSEKSATLPILSPRQGVWLIISKDEKLNKQEHAIRNKLYEHCPEIFAAAWFAYDFQKMVRNRVSKMLDGWMESASQLCSELKSFVNGLKQDVNAVKAALSMEWSNGQVEGQVNRLKMIKRKMYGRANFDLLKQRVLSKV